MGRSSTSGIVYLVKRAPRAASATSAICRPTCSGAYRADLLSPGLGRLGRLEAGRFTRFTWHADQAQGEHGGLRSTRRFGRPRRVSSPPVASRDWGSRSRTLQDARVGYHDPNIAARFASCIAVIRGAVRLSRRAQGRGRTSHGRQSLRRRGRDALDAGKVGDRHAAEDAPMQGITGTVANTGARPSSRARWGRDPA